MSRTGGSTATRRTLSRTDRRPPCTTGWTSRPSQCGMQNVECGMTVAPYSVFRTPHSALGVGGEGAPMQRYIIERLLLIIPTIIGVTMLLFLVTRVFLP